MFLDLTNEENYPYIYFDRIGKRYFCQVGICTINPNPNAVLHISDTVKGLLIPILDSLHRKNIPNTAGLMVYDSTVHSFWYNDGSSWQLVALSIMQVNAMVVVLFFGWIHPVSTGL